jgi:DNA-binding XRE family transcriptional regulator
MGVDLPPGLPASPASSDDAATFRLPSTALFLGLLPVFSGQARRGDLAAELVDDGRPRADSHGVLRSTQVRTYIVYSGRESEARTSLSLFKDDPLWQEGELSALIKRQFGPAGLKHLLGVFIAAEESASQREGFPGSFVFDVNKHLDVLGYKRANRVNNKAYHTTKHLAEAREIIALLCSLTIVQEIRLGTRRGMTVKIRLLLDEAAAESWEDVVSDGAKLRERIMTNERVYLRLNPHLFSIAAEGTRRQQFLYTHQLTRLSRENAHSQALTLTLGVHLPIKFRMSGCAPVRYTARSFLRMAGIPDEEYTAYEQLERVEKTLRYMVDQGYVSAFETPRYRYAPDPVPPDAPVNPQRPPRGRLVLKSQKPRGHEDPLEETWQVEAPAFLQQLLTAPLAPRDEASAAALPSGVGQGRPAAGAASRQPTLPGMDLGGPPPHAGELLKEVRAKLGLSQGQLARRLGFTQAAISMAEAGKRPQMAQRLFEAARRLRPDLQIGFSQGNAR